jgi:hypothetical protein
MMIRKFDKILAGRVIKILMIAGCLGGVWLISHPAFALPENGKYQAGMEEFSSTPTLARFMDVLLLMGILTCFFISVKVKSFLRDGKLASGWTLFSLSFVLWFAAQLLSLSITFNLLNISVSIISVIRLLSIFTLASGIYFMKKVLS